MKKLLLIFFLVSNLAQAQNLPACDTLIIQCCMFDAVPSDTLTLLADNPSSVLFDYPGFIILDANLDTVAKETVNYFGIGTGFQPHYLNILTPIVLPFAGKLELHTGFFSEFACSWPIRIADTVTAVHDEQGISNLKIYPNPADEFIFIGSDSGSNLEGFTSGKISIYNMMGVLVQQPQNVKLNSEIRVDVQMLAPAVYRIELSRGEKIFQSKFVKQSPK